MDLIEPFVLCLMIVCRILRKILYDFILETYDSKQGELTTMR